MLPPVEKWVAQQCQREALDGTGFGVEIYAAADRGDIRPDQAPMLVRSLLTAGVDTTVNGISATLLGLAINPDQYQRLRADPSLARIAFDESVRLHSPLTTMFRSAVGDEQLAGEVIPAGKNLALTRGRESRSAPLAGCGRLRSLTRSIRACRVRDGDPPVRRSAPCTLRGGIAAAGAREACPIHHPGRRARVDSQQHYAVVQRASLRDRLGEGLVNARVPRSAIEERRVPTQPGSSCALSPSTRAGVWRWSWPYCEVREWIRGSVRGVR